MPLYEFRCDHCEEEFEEILSSLESVDEVSCPSCGSRNVRKLLSGFSLSGSNVTGAQTTSCSSRGPFR